MNSPKSTPSTIAQRLREGVLEPMKSAFVGKDEVIELLGVSLVARENLFILGPPGTAKSAIVQDMARRIEGQAFDYLLTRFTEPNELFGPFDIRELRNGNLVTNTEGMLPEATFVFLDELLNANSAILNSLLMVLNERVFRRGREFRKLPTLLVVGASNNLPEEEALKALFDRFLLRVNCDNVPSESLESVLHAGWVLESRQDAQPALTVEEIVELQSQINTVSFGLVTKSLVDLVATIRKAGIYLSDRRVVKLQRMIAASAVMCDRTEAHLSDLWVMRYIWDTLEQQEILTAIVNRTLEEEDSTDPESVTRHKLSRTVHRPDAESLARDLDSLAESIESAAEESNLAVQKDRLSILMNQIEWVENEQQRTKLKQISDSLMQKLTDNDSAQ